ncbi:hypothetical protein LWI28_005582 [Acer negundo]|uniref:B box-type domain-containing protein n=1 Tax=Acer negundo TaxID=4023 RepID=A0AAD5J3U0_ACENE|nr:hypothetical protein LWI28_005582 [Acer negundo]KAK4851244.1 hypothetical protein QYF36_013577 [Acer negundo]
MKKCELCDRTARMYCESDQASLCWDCDEKVHRANFLVAKHSRSLLCHVCQSVTQWKASGAKLGPTVSVCEACVASAQCKARDGGVVRRENQSERIDVGGGDVNEDLDDYDDNDVDYEDEDDEEDDDDEEEEEDDDDENQVVPWSGESQSPPPVSCSSSNSSGSEEEVSLKRRRDFSDLYSDEDEIGCSSSHIGSRVTTNEKANTSMSSYKPLKQPRLTTTAASEPVDDDDDGQADSRSTDIINSLNRLQKQMITNDDGGGDQASATVLAICRLSKDDSR